MYSEEINTQEVHPRPEGREDGEATAKAFLVDFVRSTPSRAVVFASSAEEALKKFEKREVEEYDEEELDSWVEVTDVMEESQCK